MYTVKNENPNRVQGIKAYEGETIEAKIRRIVNNKEPITDGAPLIFTERKDGVRPEHNIRTDRFEVAVEAMDKVTGSLRAKREAKTDLPKQGDETKNDGKPEPVDSDNPKE